MPSIKNWLRLCSAISESLFFIHKNQKEELQRLEEIRDEENSSVHITFSGSIHYECKSAIYAIVDWSNSTMGDQKLTKMTFVFFQAL